MNNLCLILNESLIPILDWIVQFLNVGIFQCGGEGWWLGFNLIFLTEPQIIFHIRTSCLIL